MFRNEKCSRCSTPLTTLSVMQLSDGSVNMTAAECLNFSGPFMSKDSIQKAFFLINGGPQCTLKV